MSQTTSDPLDDDVTGGSALGRVLRRTLNMKKGNTETPRLRGGEGWSKRAKSVIAAHNALLRAYDRLADTMEGVGDDLRREFLDLTKRIQQTEDKRVDNNKKDREQQKSDLEALKREVETLEMKLEVEFDELATGTVTEPGTGTVTGRVTMGGRPPPPLPPPPPTIEVEENVSIPPIDGAPLDLKKLEDMLKDTEQALHQAGAQYGGLTFCTGHASDFGKDDQKKIGTLRAYNAKRLELLNKLKQGKITQEEIATLSNEVRGLNDGFGKGVTNTVDDKREKSIAAVKACGFGKEAEAMMEQLALETRTIKITDSPNPYWASTPPKPPTNTSAWNEKEWKYYENVKKSWDKALKKWDKSGMKGEVKELFNPANRYVHIDGDEKVNAAKTAAATVARDLMPDIDMEKLQTEIKKNEGDKQRKAVITNKKDEIEEQVTTGHMMDWYKTTGADMLEEAGQADLAKSWRGGDVLPSDNVELMKKINAAATSELEDFNKNTFAGAVDEAIEKEVDSIVMMKANQKRARMMEAQTMTQGDYWVELGRMAKSADFGRCFSCAGVAAQALVMNSAFDGLAIESVGAVSYDHHFVLVGRTGSDVGSTTPPAMDSKVLVIDIWQANQGGDPPANTWATFQYNAETELKVFCVMKPGSERKALRERCVEYVKKD